MAAEVSGAEIGSGGIIGGEGPGTGRSLKEASGKSCHSFVRGFARVILDRVRNNLDQVPGS
jgi:hypothetical protein